jgi:hypothetical protein
MENEVTVVVFDIVGSPYAVAVDDGQKVYEKITPLLRDGRKVTLSFEGIKTMIPPFLRP